MSQGFRKNKRPNQFFETTGIAPIQQGGEQRTAQRTEQINQLHEQFEDLKSKIKQVENKNEKIIKKIHRAYNFKKKAGYTQEFINQSNPIVHYDNRTCVYSNGGISLDSKSIKSDSSGPEVKWEKRISEAPRKRTIKNQQFHHSLEYGKNDIIDDNESIPVINVGKPPYANFIGKTAQTHHYHANPNSYQSVSSATIVPKSHGSSAKNSRNSFPGDQADLQQKSVKSVIQSLLQPFFENVVVKRMLEIEKAHKKFDQRIRNLKQSTILAKDRHEDRVSSRLIRQGKRRRSLSRSRANSPLRGSQIKQQKRESSNSRKSISRSKIAQNRQTNKQFHEIAQKYEQLINSKAQQIDKLQIKFKNKQRQCYQLKMRIDLLQRKLNEEQQTRHYSLEYESPGQKIRKQSNQSDALDSQSSPYSHSNTQAQSLYKEKITGLEQLVKQQNTQINTLTTEIENSNKQMQSVQQKNKIIHQQYEENLTTLKTKALTEHQRKAKQFESNLNVRISEIRKLTAQLSEQENKLLNKECENYTLGNKNKKLEALLQNKENKIIELQKIFGANNTPQFPDHSQESSLGQTQNHQTKKVIKNLKNDIDSLEQQLEENKNQIFTLSKTKQYISTRNEQLERENNTLKKQIQTLHMQNQQLKMSVNVHNISAVDDSTIRDKKDRKKSELTESPQILSQDLQSNAFIQSKIDLLTEEKEQWYEKYQQTKTQLLQKSSAIVKLTTELSYATKTSKINQQKYNRIKDQIKQLKKQHKQVKILLSQAENQLEIQKIENQDKINQIEKQWMEFEQYNKKNTETSDSNLLLSDRKSEKSMSIFTQNSVVNRDATKVEYLQAQIEVVNVKLKQSEAELETHKIMEERIIAEYKKNIEESKLQLKHKNNQLLALQEEKSELESKTNNMHVQIQSLESLVEQQQQANRGENASPNGNKKYIQLLDRIEELENDLKQARQINTRLTDMEGQLFQEINIKEQERVELYEEIKSKEIKTKELEDCVTALREQLTAANSKNPFKSRLSSTSSNQVQQSSNPSQHRQSVESQSSLKYSSHSNVKQFLGSSNKYSDQEGIIDLELSEAGSEFFDVNMPGSAGKHMTSSSIQQRAAPLNESQYQEQPSMISNISEMFNKQEFPYEKIDRISRTQIKRSDQLKLFEKTALYIKSLKTAIQEKDKRIKVLEKKIESLKSSQLVRKELGYLPEEVMAEDNNFHMSTDTFKDYESVQLENRRGVSSNYRKYKQLQHDTKLVMQENNMLVHQIESLQEELLKAEDQENNLVKIKDLYKDQIKKLIKKNEQQTQSFTDQLKAERKKLEQSESIHNLEVIKQLFVKIVEVAASKFTNEEERGLSSKKREEKRKQMEEYTKIMSNILQFDAKSKQHLLKQFQNK